ncbi:MAG: VWA domain-containing protein [Myxococcales bacterium]|nr:VWA domain-containing protein [Myxococcales bacterium]
MALGQGLGAGSNRQDTTAMFALGEQLLENKKLRDLARLVGLFRQVATSARKKKYEKRPTSVHSIDRGRSLSRLLASELASLRHPVLRRDFLRKYTDGLLVEYSVEGEEASGRGPLVVCIDASGSMSGAREIWAKAIALTFMDIARRENRAFRAVVFSGNPDQVRRFDLLEQRGKRNLRRPLVALDEVAAFSEYFPGGGTDFMTPLRLAVESLAESKFKDGDIVFITDGAASLSREFLRWFEERKSALEFSLFAVLVDVEGADGKVLTSFADEILKVSELTAGELAPLFGKV